MNINLKVFKSIVEKDSSNLIDILLNNDVDLEEDIKKGQIDKFWNDSTFRWGLTFADLRKMDLKKVSVKKILRLGFSDLTKWADKKNMPTNFDPQKIIEEAKSFKGLGIEELHNKGVTGKDIKVAYIDRGFDTKHKEFEDRKIEYRKMGGNDEHFHGGCVVSRLCGKNIGNAPDVNLIYYACSYRRKENKEVKIENNILNELESLREILERIKKGEEICCVGLSTSILYQIGNNSIAEQTKKILTADFLKLKEEFEKLNVPIIDSPKFWEDFTYSYKINPLGNRNDLNNYKSLKGDVSQKISILEADKCVPLVFTRDKYKYENNLGCASWSIPQIVGMFCLAKQVDNSVTYQEFVALAKNTAVQNEKGGKFIQPYEIVSQLELKKEINTQIE